MTSVRKSMIEECERLNIIVPAGATKKQMKALIDDYYKTAAVITTNNGLRFRQTDKPTAEYYIEFTISASIYVRAESEEAACEWVENENPLDYLPRSFEYIDSGYPEIINCFNAGDQDDFSPFPA